MRLWSTIAACGALLSCASMAHASGPFEFPDNGPNAFARGGAWLATSTDPMVAHYNPAALATIGSGASVSMHLVFEKVCFERRGPGDTPTGPRQGTADEASIVYRPVCNAHSDRPGFVPAFGVSVRITEDLGLGVALLPPSAYGTSENSWPSLTPGYNQSNGSSPMVPAPYRYLWLGSASTVLFPTLSAGYEIFDGFRVGAGFIWGIATIDVNTTAIALVDVQDKGDHAGDDSQTHLLTEDLFVPGFVASIHASPHERFDVSAWFRWVDAIRNEKQKVRVSRPFYDASLTSVLDHCTEVGDCTGLSILNTFEGEGFETRQIPMELRLGARYHHPRGAPIPVAEGEFSTRDTLRDDVFDIEVDGSWTNTSSAGHTVVRFAANAAGEAVLPVHPQGLLPPDADRKIPYVDTFGVRIGGQFNVIQDKLGILAGGWIESAASDDEYLHVEPVTALRGGVGGGIVVRQDNIDVHGGYQHHFSAGFDNGGNGALRAPAGTRSGEPEPFRIGGPLGENEFRSYHTINGGKLVQSANVFDVGVIVHF